MSTKMHIKCEFRTRYEPTIRYAALYTAWAKGLTFTVAGLAALTGKPVSKAMRRVLKAMVKEGLLYEFTAKDNRGKYPLYYCAQKSEQIKWYQEQM